MSYTENDADRIDFSGNEPDNEVVESGSQVSSLNIMGNLLFDFENESPFRSHFGGGPGVSIINHDLLYNAAGPNLNDNGDAVFAWQVIGGVKYDLTDRVGVFFDTRFRQAVDASNIRRIGSTPVGGAGGGRFEDDINSVILSSSSLLTTAGLRPPYGLEPDCAPPLRTPGPVRIPPARNFSDLTLGANLIVTPWSHEQACW